MQTNGTIVKMVPLGIITMQIIGTIMTMVPQGSHHARHFGSIRGARHAELATDAYKHEPIAAGASDTYGTTAANNVIGKRWLEDWEFAPIKLSPTTG